MDWQVEWTRTQQELSAASRNETWWKSLPEDRRSILGRIEYRKQCRLARQRLKLADERCRALIRAKREGEAGARPDETPDDRRAAVDFSPAA